MDIAARNAGMLNRADHSTSYYISTKGRERTWSPAIVCVGVQLPATTKTMANRSQPRLLNMQADLVCRILLLPKKVFGVGSKLHSINISAAGIFLMT